MDVDIYVKEKNGEREIRFPILPDQISFPSGKVTFISSDIMGRGEVVEPSGTDLGSCSWASEFPGAQRKNDSMLRGEWQDPKEYVSILQDWMKKGTMLTILVIGYPVNMDVYLKEFETKATGAFGDISYEINFVEARTITIVSTKAEDTQPPVRNQYQPQNYTILWGETLWEIAEKFYGDGSRWVELYNANKDVIEAHARDRGMVDSQNGRWIWGGTIIVIP